MRSDLAFALAAGTLAALNPCGFAMLPAYLALFVANGTAGTVTRPAALRRALVATGAMTVGFLAVFATFGLLLGPVASTVQRWLPVVTVVIGVALLVLGVVMVAGREIALATPKLRAGGSPASGAGSMAVYGVSYAIASLGCTIGPFLVVTSTTFRSGDIGAGLLAYAAYAAGMGLVVGVLAVAAALAQHSAARLLRRISPYLNRAAGVLMVVVGAYIAWYGWYELRVYGGGSTTDPVVEGAAAVQSTLSGWVDRLGPGTFAVVLAVLVAGALAATAVARSRRGVPGGDGAAEVTELDRR